MPHRDPSDDDSRYSALTSPDVFNFTEGWDRETWLDLLDVWERWHMNALRSACEHQRATWLPGPTTLTETRKLKYHQGLPCPECGYRIGSAWLHEDVPAEVLDFLASLPDSDKVHPWGDR